MHRASKQSTTIPGRAALAWLLSLFLCLPPQALFARVYAEGSEDPASRELIRELEFKDATVQDAIRVIGELTDVNIVATRQAGPRKFTLFLRNISVRDAVDSMARVAGLWYRYNPRTGVYVVMTSKEYQQDLVVFNDEVTRVYTLKYQNVAEAAQTIEDLFGDRVELNLDVEEDAFELSGELSSSSSSSSSTSSNRTSRTSNNTSNRNNRTSRTSSSRSSSRNSTDNELLIEQDLTPEQIARLAAMGAGGEPLVDNQTLGQVAQRTASPIYVTVNYLHNLVFVRTADEQALQAIDELVKTIDRQAPQVLLEMKIIEVALDDGFQSVFDLGFTSSSTTTGPGTGQAPNPFDSTSSTGSELSLGLGNNDLIGGSFIFQIMNDRVLARIQALETDNKVRVLSTPMVLASNNRAARLFIGDEVVITKGFDVQTTVNENIAITTTTIETEDRDIGNSLEILPSINADRSVTLRLLQDTSSVLEDGNTIPVATSSGFEDRAVDAVRTAQLETTVVAQDGMTVALGGLIQEDDQDNVSKVPILGDIPMLGTLFRSTEKGTNRSELILLITPHVFTTPGEAESGSRKRLDALMEHPNRADEYLDEVHQSRSPEQQAQLPAELQASAQRATARLEQVYINLVRHAARAVREPAWRREASDGIEPVRMTDKGPRLLFPDTSLEAAPVDAWRDGHVHVTALRLTNLGATEQPLDERQLRGHWLAATLEQDHLSPGASTYVYLVSNRSFERAAVEVPRP